MDVNEARFDCIDHTADIGYVCTGTSQAELFEKCAVSLSAIMFEGHDTDSHCIDREVTVEEESVELLLVRFLNEILFLWETEYLIPNRVEVDAISTTTVTATVYGEFYQSGVHEIVTEIKAATYHCLRVDKTGSGWEAQVIFDV